METILRKNNTYEILTPHGWSDFDGISKNQRSDIIKIILEDKNFLVGTSNHKILNEFGNFIELKNVRTGMSVQTKNGNMIITDVQYIIKSVDVYDVYNVYKDNIYFSNGLVSHNCNEYLGSSGTLIAGWKLKELVAKTPVAKGMGVNQYKKPKEGNTYVAIVDVSRGKGLDYSAVQIIDVTKMPYEQVLVYRDNMTTPGDFAEIIYRLGTQYNKCPVLVEVNDIGQQVSESLYFDFEYDNVLFTENMGKNGKRITHSFKGVGSDRGVRTTKTVKSIGCSMLKLLIEQNQLIINDSETISELSTFSKKANSYQAEVGCNDDLVMCLVLFGWLSEQDYFKSMTEINTLIKLKDMNKEEMDSEMLPLGFYGSDADVSDEYSRVQDNWMVVSQNSFFDK